MKILSKISLLAYLPVSTAYITEKGEVREGWMGANWDKIKDLSIANLTLPGSHNSGNVVGELNADNLCESDYKYYDRYLSQSRQQIMVLRHSPRSNLTRRSSPGTKTTTSRFANNFFRVSGGFISRCANWDPRPLT